MTPNRKPPDDDQSLPPNDAGAEQGCLACILTASDEAARSWLSDLSVDYFYDLRNQEIYRALTCLNGDEINVVTLYQFLSDKNRLEDAGGSAYVQALPNQTPSPSMWSSYFAPLESCRLRRAVIRDAAELSLIAKNRALDLPLISDAARRIASSYATGSNSKNLTMQMPASICAMQFDDSDRILGDRLLSRGQSLVITGAGSLGKSRIAIQMSACIISSRPFLGLETRGENLKWLFLQAENSNLRLQADLNAIKDWLNPYEWERFNKQVLIHTLETDTDYYLSLDNQDVCNRIIATLRRFKPDIIVWDSLYNFAIGDLNKDEDMSNTLLTLSRVSKTDNSYVSNILLHHAITGKIGASKAIGFDRSSFARNSKVLHSWTRGQINIAPGSSESNDTLVVTCGKCSNGKEFPPFGAKLNEMSMIYEIEPNFSLKGWEDELKGKEKAMINSQGVAALIILPTTRDDLKDRIIRKTGVTPQTANRYIRAAQSDGIITFDNDSELFSRETT